MIKIFDKEIDLNLVFTLGVFALLLTLGHEVFAAEGDGTTAAAAVDLTSIGTFFQGLVEGLVSNVLTWVAALGLIILGISAWFGRMQWNVVGWWLLGCVVVFGAVKLADTMSKALGGKT